jgi:hypothetical protein
MTIAYLGHLQQKIADAKSEVRSRLGQLSDETLHRVAIWAAGGMVAGGAVLAASNVGAEQHTWWGWLLIGAPLIWLAFLGAVALTSGALRVVVGALRWSFSVPSPSSADVSVAGSRWTGPQVLYFDAPISRLARAA